MAFVAQVAEGLSKAKSTDDYIAVGNSAAGGYLTWKAIGLVAGEAVAGFLAVATLESDNPAMTKWLREQELKEKRSSDLRTGTW